MHVHIPIILLAVTGLFSQVGSAQSVQSDAELEQFKIEIGQPNGVLVFTGRASRGYHRAYACPNFLVAESVVEATRGAQVRQRSASAQRKSLNNYLQRNHCKPAKGKFRILAKGREVEINHGQEASEYWTALKVSTIEGQETGLVFDASPYAAST